MEFESSTPDWTPPVLVRERKHFTGYYPTGYGPIAKTTELFDESFCTIGAMPDGSLFYTTENGLRLFQDDQHKVLDDHSKHTVCLNQSYEIIHCKRQDNSLLFTQRGKNYSVLRTGAWRPYRNGVLVFFVWNENLASSYYEFEGHREFGPLTVAASLTTEYQRTRIGDALQLCWSSESTLIQDDEEHLVLLTDKTIRVFADVKRALSMVFLSEDRFCLLYEDMLQIMSTSGEKQLRVPMEGIDDGFRLGSSPNGLLLYNGSCVELLELVHQAEEKHNRVQELCDAENKRRKIN